MQVTPEKTKRSPKWCFLPFIRITYSG